MNRQQLEHVIAAAANVIDLDEFVVVGSQAVLGTLPVAPSSMLISMEADVYPLRQPERAIEVDGALGDGSPFQRTYGYYAHGVGPETAKLPRGWEDRRARVDVPPRRGPNANRLPSVPKSTTSFSRNWRRAASATSTMRVRPRPTASWTPTSSANALLTSQ